MQSANVRFRAIGRVAGHNRPLAVAFQFECSMCALTHPNDRFSASTFHQRGQEAPMAVNAMGYLTMALPAAD